MKLSTLFLPLIVLVFSQGVHRLTRTKEAINKTIKLLDLLDKEDRKVALFE